MVEVQLAAAPDLDGPPLRFRQLAEQGDDGGDRGAIVAAVRGAADEEPDAGTGGVHGAPSLSIRTSRKCVAHEMHGS